MQFKKNQNMSEVAVGGGGSEVLGFFKSFPYGIDKISTDFCPFCVGNCN